MAKEPVWMMASDWDTEDWQYDFFLNEKKSNITASVCSQTD